MASTSKIKYRTTNSDVITITLASLAQDASLLAGRAGTAYDNTTDLDDDKLLSGSITTGATSTNGSIIEIWHYAARKVASGSPTYPDSITGTDAAKTMTSLEQKYAGLRLAYTITVNATANRIYDIPPISVKSLYGGKLPKYGGAFVTHNTGGNLNATQDGLFYDGIQGQLV